MSARQSTAALRQAFRELNAAMPPADQLVANLRDGYSLDRIAANTQVRRQLLLAERRRPRLSPSSLLCLEAALRHGGFYYTFGLRDELLTGWREQDKRWQTGFIQHHGIVRSVGNSDAHIEVHDQNHAMLGLAWWDGITWEQFYLASMISESTASYHYFFLDAVFEPRCEPHAGIVDVTKIMKLHTCDDCNQEGNVYFNLPPLRRQKMESVALEYAHQANWFFVRETRLIEDQLIAGLGFVVRNPVNVVGNARDSLRYAYYLYPVLKNRHLAPYFESLGSWQCARSMAEYVARAASLIRMCSGQSERVSEDWKSVLPWRRRLLVSQDLLLRCGLLLAQAEIGLRQISPDSYSLLESILAPALVLARECLSSAGADRAPSGPHSSWDDRLKSLFEQLAGARCPEEGGARGIGASAASVGYDLSLALDGSEPNERLLEQDEDLTLITSWLTSLFGKHLPKTLAMCHRMGRAHELISKFRESTWRWMRTRDHEVDGRCPEYDEQLQRFVLWLEHRAASEGDLGLRDIAERARIEYRLLRYASYAALDLDVRSQIFTFTGDPSVALVRFNSSVELVRSTLDLTTSDPETTPHGGRGKHLYALSIRGDRVAIVKVSPITQTVREGLRHPLSEGELIRWLCSAASIPPEEAQRAVDELFRLEILSRFAPDPAQLSQASLTAAAAPQAG